MSDFEIIQSLPKRPTAMRGREDGDYVRDDDGQLLRSGSIAGVVVFPPETSFALLRAWLERRGKVATGSVASIVSSLEHARPNSERVSNLRAQAAAVGKGITKALPRPRK